ncbi:MAG: methyltransferase domain-containing protein [Aestuariivirga sp.]
MIERMGEKGDGLSAGHAYPYTLPGETATASGKIIKASPDRVVAFCSVFETCGGCKLQHWREEPYRQWKTALLASALKARGLETEIKPLIDAHGAGRRRVSLHVREAADRWRAGFMAEGSHNLVPIDTCPILVPNMQSAPEIAAKFGPFFGACDVSITSTDNGLDIAIKATRKLAEKAIAPFDALMRANGITRIALNGQTLTQLAPPLVNLGKAQVALPVGSFLQATAKGESVLGDVVFAHAKKAKRILDLFCGVGPFTFKLAEASSIHAVDSDKPAIAALQFAMRNVQGLKPITAEVRDLFRNPLVQQELNEFDLVVLDPPRAGAEAQCQNLAKSTVKRVIYVSCDVQSLARDAAVLTGGGYMMTSATPVDQFKFSPHLEVVASFTRS